MGTKHTTDEFGQTVVTRTVQNGITVKATITNEFAGQPSQGAGIVDVLDAHGTPLLRFNHTMAEGAAEELTLAFRTTWIYGQQAGGQVAFA